MDFEKRLAELERQYSGANSFERAAAFLDVHLRWAEALEASDPEAAVRQYELAENCEGTIGSGATSGGEGIASMIALHEIMGKRADVLERIADASSDADTALRRLAEAQALWKTIQNDPNGLGERTPAASRSLRLAEKIRRARGRG